MKLTEFIVEIVHYAAWPVVVLILLYWFRQPIRGLLKRRIRYKLGPHTVEVLEEINKETAKVAVDSSTAESRLDLVERIAYDNVLIMILLAIASEEVPNAEETRQRAIETLAMALSELEEKRPDSPTIPTIRDFNRILKL